MFNFLKEAGAQFQNFLQNLSAGKRVGLLLITGLVMAGFIVMILWSQSYDYQVLYGNLAQGDASSIVSRLKEEKVPYRITGGGKSILVPREKVYETRLQLASEGLPQGGGAGYELFDKNNFGLTEFVQKLNHQRALQGELSRTINQLSEIDKSRVHLVMPEDSLFTEDKKEATASVFLKVLPGRGLRREQVEGIVHLIASSVIGLQSQNITVVDQNGNILFGGEDNSYIGRVSNSQLEYQDSLEKRLENRVQSILERVAGKGRVLARVSTELDFNQVEKTEEKYDPEGQVVRSQNSIQEKSKGGNSVPAGVPGVMSNVPQGQNKNQPGMSSSNNFQKTNETVNYEINKVTQRTIATVGKIKRLSVAVMVDGNRKVVKGVEQYTPRTRQELKKYESIVKNAIGFDAERKDEVVVENIPFEKIDFADSRLKILEKAEWRHFYVSGIRYAVSAMLILLGILFIVRPIMKGLATGIKAGGSVQQLPRTVQELEAELDESANPEIETAQRKKIAARDKVAGLAKEEPAYVAELVRSWLNERK